MDKPAWYRWDGADLILRVRVQPRASRMEIADVQQARLRIRLTAPPLDGKANAQLSKLLAAAFAVPKSSITLIHGQSGRDKSVRISSPERLPKSIDPPAR